MEPAARDIRLQSACQMALATVAIGAAIYWLRPMLMPFVLALFFACGIVPLLDVIEKQLRAPRIVAVAIAFLLGMALVALLWLVIWLSVQSLLSNGDVYRERFRELVARVAVWLDEPEPTGASPAPEEDSPKLTGFTSANLSALLSRLSAALMDLFSSAVMVLIFMFFLLLGGGSQAVPRTGVWPQIEGQIRNYIVTKTVISMGTGAAFGLILWLFGIPMAVLFGLLAFLLNFIPNIGPIIASVLPLPLILLDPDLSILGMILVILLTSGIQLVSGNVVEPKIMGSSFELHPVAILLTLLLWGMLWGIVGMFLATPITAAIKILLEKFPATKPIAQLLAGDLQSLNFGDANPPAA